MRTKKPVTKTRLSYDLEFKKLHRKLLKYGLITYDTYWTGDTCYITKFGDILVRLLWFRNGKHEERQLIFAIKKDFDRWANSSHFAYKRNMFPEGIDDCFSFVRKLSKAVKLDYIGSIGLPYFGDIALQRDGRGKVKLQ